MKAKIIYLFLFGLFIIACGEKEDDDPRPIQENPVILSSLETGQKSYFKRYHLECNTAPGFEWTSDTLVLEVVESESQLYLQESLTPESPMFLNGGFQEPVLYPIQKEGDKILLTDRANSALFFFYANDTLQINPNHDVTLTQAYCRLQFDDSPFIGNDIGYVESVAFGEVRLENQTVVSCEPFFNLDAYLFYSDGQLNMSHVITLDGELEEVYGWCKI